MLWTLLLAFVFCSVPNPSAAAPPSELELRTLYRRGIINETDVQSSYDYIIAGGGLAGLVLASRLSENPNITVLVLEAGKSGDEVADQIDAPAGAYYSSIVGSDYDWQHETIPQPNLNNRVIGWPRGKILGGSSAMNAMYVVRPSETELDAWQEVVAAASSSSSTSSPTGNWGWDQMYQYMKKAENYTAPTPEVLDVVDIKYDASTQGSGGPMQVSFPGIMINILANWTQSCADAGIPEQEHPNGGVTHGGFITPSSINPTNYTRSYSRAAYIDPILPSRPNLHILPETTVVRLILNDSPFPASSSNINVTSGQPYPGDYQVNGVEWASDAEAPRKQVAVKREVLLAGGALGTPKVLMLSGVGPRDVLEAASVDVKVELPGVGQRLQDHLTAGVVWQTNLETAGNIEKSNSDFSRSAAFLSFINDAVAFANISLMFPAEGSSAAFQSEISAAGQNTSNIDAWVPSSSPEVKAGYKRIYDVMAGRFWDAGVAQVEMLMSVISPGVVAIQSAIQHPYSIGRAWINDTDPFAPILIDPQYFSHPADLVLMRQGIKLVRTVGAALSAHGDVAQEISPGPDVQTDADIESWIVNEGAGTQYHPTGSCAMLPREMGGVVGGDLRVYGLRNVRVVDASVFPFEFAAHLASATYGVAEQASDMLKANSYVVDALSAHSAGLRSVSTSTSSVVLGAAVVLLVCLPMAFF